MYTRLPGQKSLQKVFSVQFQHRKLKCVNQNFQEDVIVWAHVLCVRVVFVNGVVNELKVMQIKCPMCENYFDVKKVIFKKLYRKQKIMIRVCPGCYEKSMEGKW
jgi:hypothetical protein